MWHEARKQERLIRGMIVDYRRRAERRKDFYEKIKAEPTQFLQLHGRPCKVQLDPAVAAAGEGPAIMMPWQGDTSNMIDRFDVRAHLDTIPEIKIADVPPEDLNTEERQCNYERYRILAQNVFLGISEDKFLQQLAIEEQFGVTIEEKEMQKERLHDRKGTGAAIGYNYSDPGAQPSCSNGPEIKKVEQKESDDDMDLEIIDVDLSIDVNKMEASQAHELNAVGPQFGMAGCDLFSFLTGDADDAEHQKQLLREEKEKAMFSGRKSRRERRAHRDKKLASRVVSPPSYAAHASQTPRSPTPSPSRSPSPDAAATDDKIQFITSFGGDEEELKTQPASKPLYSEKVKKNLKKMEMLYSEVTRNATERSSTYQESRPRPLMGPRPLMSLRPMIGPRPLMGPRLPSSKSRSRSLSRSKSPRSRSRSRPRSVRMSRSKSRSRSSSSRSRSRSYSPYKRSRSRSKSRNYKNRHSRSPANHASGYAKRNKSRSLSYDSDDRGGQSKPSVPRYYGRRKEDKSSSDLSLDSASSDSADDSKSQSAVGNQSNTNQNQILLSGSSSKGASRETISLKEKLKRKMQAQLSRQLRADKRLEAERLDRESRRQARRDEEMRDLAIKLRRKQREMRHQQNRRSTDDSDSQSGSSSGDSPPKDKKKEDRSRSKSKSPKDKRIPVWEAKKESVPLLAKPKLLDIKGHPPPLLELPRRPYHDYPELYRDDRRANDGRQPYPYRCDRYPNRDYPRYDNRFEQFQGPDNNYLASRRRPFGFRGGYRGQGYRQGGPEYYGDGPHNYNTRDGAESSDYSKKVKLVDY